MVAGFSISFSQEGRAENFGGWRGSGAAGLFLTAIVSDVILFNGEKRVHPGTSDLEGIMNLKPTHLWSLILLVFFSTPAVSQQVTKADLQALGTKVSNLEQKVSNLEQTVNKIDQRLSTVEKTTNDIDKRLIRLETKVDEMDKRLTNHIVELDKRLTARIDLLFWAIGALIGIVLTVIALPQLLGYFQEKRGREDLQR
jgi:tetrahydromethanopterin S-methyltransferase subunit G